MNLGYESGHAQCPEKDNVRTVLQARPVCHPTSALGSRQRPVVAIHGTGQTATGGHPKSVICKTAGASFPRAS